MRVTVVGLGPGAGRDLTGRAREALERVRAVCPDHIQKPASTIRVPVNQLHAVVIFAEPDGKALGAGTQRNLINTHGRFPAVVNTGCEVPR